jgi:hypothetical protein
MSTYVLDVRAASIITHRPDDGGSTFYITYNHKLQPDPI